MKVKYLRTALRSGLAIPFWQMEDGEIGKSVRTKLYYMRVGNDLLCGRDPSLLDKYSYSCSQPWNTTCQKRSSTPDVVLL